MKIMPEFYQVPLKFPANFIDIAMSRHVIPPQRFIVSVQQQLTSNEADQKLITELIRQMYKEIFKSDQQLTPLSDPDRLRHLAEAAGLDKSTIDTALQNMNSDQVKNELRTNVKEACENGTYGTPSIVAHCPDYEQPQLIFGSDRFEILAYLLKEKYYGPTPSA